MKTIKVTKEIIHQSITSDSAYFFNNLLKNIKNDTTVIIENDTYLMKCTYAIDKQCYISNNDEGKKRIGFPLENKNNIVIDGNGSLLQCFGKILPFHLKLCKNITLKNFVIDYERQFVTQGEVLASTPTSAVLKIDKKMYPYEIKHGIIHFVGENYISEYVWGLLEFNKDEKRPVSDAIDNRIHCGMIAEELEEGIIKLYHEFLRQPRVGNIVTIKHDFRDNPGITIDECENIKLENIWIKYAGSMAIIAQVSKDITLDNIKVAPDKNSGRMISANADATHFVNCQGTILVENSLFRNTLDDIINVHGNFMKVNKIIDATRFIAEFGHFQQEGVNIFKKGDVISFYKENTMEFVTKSMVLKSRSLNKKHYEILIDTPFHFEENVKYCIDSFDRYPKVIFRNNICGKNRARGLLLTTNKDVLVENNILDCEGTTIKVNGDMKFWYESTQCGNILVKNNRFIRNNQGNWGIGLVDVDAAMLQEEKGTFFHGDIVIEDNDIFITGSRPLFFGFSFKSIIIRNNRITSWEKVNFNQPNKYIQAHNYKECNVYGNTVTLEKLEKMKFYTWDE